MIFFINIAALFLCWFGSSCVYAASERQMIFSNTISKNIGWSLFSFSMISAFILLLNLHHWLSALLILIVLIMLIWIVLALVAPYFPYQRKTLIYGTSMIIVTALIGGFYVV